MPFTYIVVAMFHTLQTTNEWLLNDVPPRSDAELSCIHRLPNCVEAQHGGGLTTMLANKDTSHVKAILQCNRSKPLLTPRLSHRYSM